MGEVVFKLPDVGEGVAEAELVEWHVKIGDLIREDAPLAAVMTDKATVEIPSPAEGEIVWLAAEVGDLVAVGSDLVRLKVAGDGQEHAAKGARKPARAKAQAAIAAKSAPANSGVPSPLRGEGQGEGGLAPDANLAKTPSPQPSPSKLASASLPPEFPHPLADAEGGRETAPAHPIRGTPLTGTALFREGVIPQPLRGRPLSHGERDRVRGVAPEIVSGQPARSAQPAAGAVPRFEGGKP